MRIVEDTSPARPIDVKDMAEHLRVDMLESDEQDVEEKLIGDYLDSATGLIESATGHFLAKRDVTAKFNEFPERDVFEIDAYPVDNIKQIDYFDEDGNKQTFDNSNYFEDTLSNPARIILKKGESWPETEDNRPNAVEVKLEVGYENIPDRLLSAIRLLTAHYYENREALHKQATISEIPMPQQVRDLITANKVKHFAG